TKRMSNNWMARAAYSTSDDREYFPGGLTAMLDPTPTPTASVVNNTSGPNINGGMVITTTTGSGKGSTYLILPKYQFTFQGAYQAAYGITFGANYLFRQGYALPYDHTRVSTGDVLHSTKTVLTVGGRG